MRYRKDETGRKQHAGFRTSSFTPEDAYVACVAVKIEDGKVMVRDTKDPSDTTLTFTEAEWRAFLLGCRNNEFDI